MPIFEYRCSRCQSVFEKILRAQIEEIPCPSCGAAASRVVSAASVRSSAIPSCPPAGCGSGGFS